MITVDEAIAILEKNTQTLPTQILALTKAQGMVLAEDVMSPIDMPSFDQSAMDGYAFSFVDNENTYKVIGEVAAGSPNNPSLKPGEGVRIFTGAMVPDDANIVVQQEWIEREGDFATITEKVEVGKNIRPKGEQIKNGEVALEKGQVLNPAAIGFLSGLGVVAVKVYRKPNVVIITTGNELVPPGNQLRPGQIYESNSYMLEAALAQEQLAVQLLTVADSYEETLKKIKQAVKEADLLLLTGGISVGEYDFVGKALHELGTTELFYKVKQKPGKPLFAGRLEETMVMALPGNPAAALNCYYIYVLPALEKMMGFGFKGLLSGKVRLVNEVKKKAGRAHFLKARIHNDGAEILQGQSSAMLRSFAQANALVYLPAANEGANAGEEVKVFYLKA